MFIICFVRMCFYYTSVNLVNFWIYTHLHCSSNVQQHTTLYQTIRRIKVLYRKGEKQFLTLHWDEQNFPIDQKMVYGMQKQSDCICLHYASLFRSTSYRTGKINIYSIWWWSICFSWDGKLSFLKHLAAPIINSPYNGWEMFIHRRFVSITHNGANLSLCWCEHARWDKKSPSEHIGIVGQTEGQWHFEPLEGPKKACVLCTFHLFSRGTINIKRHSEENVKRGVKNPCSTNNK